MPNKKLYHSFEYSQPINGQTDIHQKLIITVNYNIEEDTLDVLDVFLYQNGAYLGEISGIMHKAPGDPLSALVEAINWQEIYSDTMQNLEI